MKQNRSPWYSVAILLLTACSADADDLGRQSQHDTDGIGGGSGPWGEGGAGAVGAGAVGAGDVGAGDVGAGDVGAGGTGAGDVGPGGADSGGGEPVGPAVCYPGPNGDDDACVPLVQRSPSWGSSYAYPSHASPQYQEPLFFVDLVAADPNLAISENFVLSELLQEWKGPWGVFQAHVVEKIQEIRDITGGAIHVNSGYRSPGYNSSVGGATYSRHMYGDAVDMWSSVVSLSQLQTICEQLGAGYIGTYSTFVHCDWRNDPLDPSFFLGISALNTGPDDLGSTMPEHIAELVLADDGVTWSAPATGFDEGEPLRTWTAYDAANEPIETLEDCEYQPPAQAVWLHVNIGGNVELDTEL